MLILMVLMLILMVLMLIIMVLMLILMVLMLIQWVGAPYSQKPYDKPWLIMMLKCLYSVIPDI